MALTKLKKSTPTKNILGGWGLLLTVTLFSIAMGFLESSVVIYLRKLYYPNGFALPLAAIDKDIMVTEILREAATIIMLLTIGIIAGKTKASRFAYFIFCFGVWDIFYYVFLKLLINWPLSIMDWDVLFLIPLPWFGPVLVPCLISCTMLLLACYIIVTEKKGIPVFIGKREWLLLSFGSLAFVWSCIDEYVFYINNAKTTFKNSTEFTAAVEHFIPTNFDWTTFLIAELLLLAAIVLLMLQTKKRAAVAHSSFT